MRPAFIRLGSGVRMKYSVVPSRRLRRRSRGQSLVELAIVLPVVLLVVVVAVDLGRAFFGYVTLTNATRLGANYAASHPNAWGTPGNAAEQAAYTNLVTADTDRANCALVVDGTGNPPAPTFTDGSDTDTPDANNDVGDRVEVALTCTFRPITPLIGALLGSNLAMSANSEFSVRTGSILGVPVAPAPTPGPTPTPTPTATPGPTPTPTPTPGPTPTPTPTPCFTVPDLVNPSPTTVAQARSEWTAAGFTGSFSPNGQNNRIVLGQNPAAGSCLPANTAMTVTHS